MRSGKYKQAHKVLFDVARQLERAGAPPANDIMRALCLLHSYILVKVGSPPSGKLAVFVCCTMEGSHGLMLF